MHNPKKRKKKASHSEDRKHDLIIYVPPRKIKLVGHPYTQKGPGKIRNLEGNPFYRRAQKERKRNPTRRKTGRKDEEGGKRGG